MSAYQRPLSPTQAGALREIRDQGGLIRGSADTAGYWQWRYARSKYLTHFPSITVEGLKRRGLVIFEDQPDGTTLCKIAP